MRAGSFRTSRDRATECSHHTTPPTGRPLAASKTRPRRPERTSRIPHNRPGQPRPRKRARSPPAQHRHTARTVSYTHLGEIDQKHLDQRRGPAHEIDIGADDPACQAIFRQTDQTRHGADRRAEQHAKRRQFQGDDGASGQIGNRVPDDVPVELIHSGRIFREDPPARHPASRTSHRTTSFAFSPGRRFSSSQRTAR